MRLRRIAAALVGFAGALVSFSLAAQDAITISARPLPLFDRSVPDNRFGPLTFLGGLVLSSSDPRFEALSGLEIIPQGDGERLVIVTDEGDWLTADLATDEAGAPLTLTNAVIGSLTGSDGMPLGTKRLADAEAVTLVDDELWVAFERHQPIRRYAWDGQRLALGATLPYGDREPLTAHRNSGPEALVHVTSGPLAGETLVFNEERRRDRATLGDHVSAARLLPDGRSVPFAYRRLDGFAVTGAAALPDGDIIVLERRFAWTEGLFIRLRHLSAEAILAGAVEGRLLLDADETAQIDNLEGIAVTAHRGGPILTLISDDNGSFFQRTLLLRFQITGNVEDAALPTPPNPAVPPR